MRSVHYKNITWHDDPEVSEAELTELRKKYGFHELDIEDCLSEHERPKIEEYEGYLFLVFHIPYQNKKTKRIQKEEINIFLGVDFIVTIHQGRIPRMEMLWNELDNFEEKREKYFGQGTGFFLYELMSSLFEEGFPLVDSMTKNLRVIEDELFESDEQIDLLKDIMTLKRNIITMRAILLPQRSLIAMLEHKNKKFVSEQLSLYFDDILDAIERQWALLDTAKEMIDALQDTHESWLSHKTNSVVRILTTFSVTMLPLTVLTGLYGMNVKLPYAEHPAAFAMVAGMMAGIVLVLVGYFAWKKWL